MTAYNLSTHDKMLDSPTNNFCVYASNMNPTGSGSYLKEGNLRNLPVDGTPNGTIKVGAGKWYWEWYCETASSRVDIAIASDGKTESDQTWGREVLAYRSDNGNKWTGTAAGSMGWSAYGATFGDGDRMACALDMDNKCVYFAKNGVWQNSGDPTSGATQTGAITLLPQEDYMHWGPAQYTAGSIGMYLHLNCGQDGTFIGMLTNQGNTDGNGIGNFYYTPPTGFLALCTKNLPTPSIKPKEHYNTILYTDTGAVRSITGVGFQPDLVVIKTRNHGNYPNLFDSLRGVGKTLHPSTTGLPDNAPDTLTSFDSDGFGLGADASGYGVNYDNKNEVSWSWKAGGAGSSNTNGSINTISTSASSAAGFSISKYTGTGSNATVGHGLSEPPNLVIIKNITTAGNSWVVGAGIGTYGFDGYNFDHQYLTLDTTANWANPTSTLFQGTGGNNGPWPTNQFVRIGTNDKVNKSGDTFVMYCWHSVLGYSMIGSYNGDATDDGPLVHCGFKPAWILIKNEGSGSNWWVFDSKRTGAVGIRIDTSGLEESGVALNGKKILDIYSNGFKLRNSSYGDVNLGSGGTHLYMAFAEIPFKYANAN